MPGELEVGMTYPPSKPEIERAAAALRFLAEHDRPGGGQQRYNSEHLHQLAYELERGSAQCAPERDRLIHDEAWEFVKTGFQTFELPDDRLREYAKVIEELIQIAVQRERAAVAPQAQQAPPVLAVGAWAETSSQQTQDSGATQPRGEADATKTAQPIGLPELAALQAVEQSGRESARRRDSKYDDVTMGAAAWDMVLTALARPQPSDQEKLALEIEWGKRINALAAVAPQRRDHETLLRKIREYLDFNARPTSHFAIGLIAEIDEALSGRPQTAQAGNIVGGEAQSMNKNLLKPRSQEEGAGS